MPLQITLADRLAEVRAGWPSALKLAEPLSIASRIEPELVRAVRMRLFPRSKGSMEAEFYFSPVVAQRTAQWVALDPEIALELQAELAQRVDTDVDELRSIERVHDLVSRAHASAPWEIAREEEITWLSVARPFGEAGTREQIDRLLGDVLRLLLISPEQGGVVARWFASAVKRLPRLARETPSFALLGFAASSVLSGRKIETGVEPTLETFEALTAYLPESAPRTTVWAGLTTGGLHIVPRETSGYVPVELPLTNPLLLDVREEGKSPRLAAVAPGEPIFVALSGAPVRLRTLGRELLTFRARERVGSESPVQSQRDGMKKRVFISYANADSELHRRLDNDLTEMGYPVWSTAAEFPLERMRRELEEAECVIVLWSDAAASSRYVQEEMRLAQELEKPLIYVVTPGDAGVPRDTAFIDFAEGDYFDNLRRLAHGIDAVRISQLHGIPQLPSNYRAQPEVVQKLHERILGSSAPIAIVSRRGAGKTLLAAEYGRSQQAREAFPGGIVWFASGEHQRAFREEAPERLLILDNVEFDEALRPDIRALLRRNEDLKVLFTTDEERVGKELGAELFAVDEPQVLSIVTESAAIVLARGLEVGALNLTLKIWNPGMEPISIQAVDCGIVTPEGMPLETHWTVFFETAAGNHVRTGEPRPFIAEPGPTQIGIQFQAFRPIEWRQGLHVLSITARTDSSPPAIFTDRREMHVGGYESAEVRRWQRASEEQWARLHDEAIGIPVRVSPAHPWAERVSVERFVSYYERGRGLSSDRRESLIALLQLIDSDREISDVHTMAYLLAVIEDETGGTFRPVEAPRRPEAAQTGQPYDPQFRGRGYILIEGRDNYARLSEGLQFGDMLLREPDRLLNSQIAYQALQFLVLHGGLTGRRLSEFVNAERADYLEARRTGLASPNVGERVARRASELEELLRMSLIPRYPGGGATGSTA